MAKTERRLVLDRLIGEGLVPVFNNTDIGLCKKIIDSCRAGGSTIIEFTNRGDGAWAIFRDLAIHYDHDLIMGAGSVMDAPTASLYMSNGADFIVSPAFIEEIARICNRRKIPYIPGCGTVTEISRAEEFGSEICKIFPGDAVGGPGFVKAVKGPMPWTRLMATGGVDATEESIKGWFEAGVSSVGMGSKLMAKDAIAKGDFASITRNVKNVLGWIKSSRK